MITLITGLPGLGKTAMGVSMLLEWVNGPRFVMGVPELQLDHEKCPPVEEWTELREDPDDPSLKLPYYTFPAGSLIFLDEAQRIFRPRPTGSKVPDHVAAYETHRHTGVDFILLTQHAGLIDSNIRKLVKRHIHLHPTFLGTQRLEWEGVHDPESKSDRDIAARSSYKPPKHVFGLYKSAVSHLKQPRAIPKYVYLLGVCIVLFAGTGWFLYHRMHDRLSPATASSPGSLPPGGQAVPSSTSSRPGPKTVVQWIQDQQPRVQGLAYSAPAYDQVTQPTEAPYPAACVQSEGQGCRCYSQQATRLDVPVDLCRQIVARGFFVAWKPKQQAPGPGGGMGRDGAAGPAQAESWSWKRAPEEAAGETRTGGSIGWHEPPSVKDQKG